MVSAKLITSDYQNILIQITYSPASQIRIGHYTLHLIYGKQVVTGERETKNNKKKQLPCSSFLVTSCDLKDDSHHEHFGKYKNT